MQLTLRWCTPACVDYDWSGRVPAHGLLTWTRASGSRLCALPPCVFRLLFVLLLFFLAIEVLFPTQAFLFFNRLVVAVFVVRACPYLNAFRPCWVYVTPGHVCPGVPRGALEAWCAEARAGPRRLATAAAIG